MWRITHGLIEIRDRLATPGTFQDYAKDTLRTPRDLWESGGDFRDPGFGSSSGPC